MTRARAMTRGVELDAERDEVRMRGIHVANFFEDRTRLAQPASVDRRMRSSDTPIDPPGASPLFEASPAFGRHNGRQVEGLSDGAERRLLSRGRWGLDRPRYACRRLRPRKFSSLDPFPQRVSGKIVRVEREGLVDRGTRTAAIALFECRACRIQMVPDCNALSSGLHASDEVQERFRTPVREKRRSALTLLDLRPRIAQ
jgi:hypothetical protein